MQSLTQLQSIAIPVLIVFAIVFLGIGFWRNWIQWIFLCEVQWLAALFLLALPIAAVTVDKSLVQGAYEVTGGLSAFYVTLALGLCAVSIAWTAQLEFNLGGDRLKEKRPLGRPIWTIWLGGLLLVAGLVMNCAVTHVVSTSSGPPSPWVQVDVGLLFGSLVSVAFFITGEWFIGILDGRFRAGKVPPLLHGVIRIMRNLSKNWPAQFKDGYIGGSTYPEIGHIAATIGLIASAIAYFLLGGQSLPPLSCLALLTTAFVWLLSGLSFFLQVFRIPAIVPVVIWLYLASSHQNADHFYRIEPTNTVPPTPIDFLSQYDPEKPMLVVTAAGGGIQAAAWTAQVLSGLQAECDKKLPGRFGDSISLVSGVSGGSVGLMYYVGARLQGASDVAVAAIAARESSLSQVTKALAYDDLCRAFLPFFLRDIYQDRGKALGDAWVENARTFGTESYYDALNQATLRSWGAAAVAGKIPAVIFNSTVVEAGKRFAFSTVPLLSASSPNGFQEFSLDFKGYDIPIATAARLSSAFTFVSPAARPNAQGLETAEHYEYLHLVDGGYLDNSGISGLVEWLRQTIDQIGQSSPQKLPKKIMLIEIGSFPNVPEEYRKPQRGTFFQIWAPVLTLSTIQGAGHAASAQRELALFQNYCNSKGIEFGWKIFQFEGFNPANPTAGPEPPPLSWHLTREQKQAIEDNWKKEIPKAGEVISFLDTGSMSVSQ